MMTGVGPVFFYLYYMNYLNYYMRVKSLYFTFMIIK